ncbi:tetratricopeptide repeat protein [Eubacterium oxidoreducens]|uniref:TolA-binding protein n=1 Tax=Eubacterium oxidoreducens TaxID=1732 RepID=A0A1G6ACD6_EUBOX|nr:tetratricopeptide repeat protein [Eubacterium oxidoreducens]SDB06094.1 TolA-binding protein [Eubacterium oxidoreducens]
MKCYSCGATLGADIVCPNCGLQVKVYKKLMNTSNYYYNEALNRAAVRDLSGAVEDLQRSLKFNKNHTDARNLLGLIYYEMGEVVLAIGEWVISKNLNPNDNIADQYLKDVQNNQNQLDTVNKTIKKYNQALMYCHQGSYDLAIIQLKKVIAMNAHYVRAYQLLALLYIHEGEYQKARATLKSAFKIDAHNVTTLSYMKEVRKQLHLDGKKSPVGKKDDLVTYKSGNDTVIRPKMTFRETTAGMTILNIILGVIIGVLVTAFLVVPSVRQAAKTESNTAVSEANDTITTKDEKISSLEAEIESLEEKNTSLQEEVDSGDDKISSYDYLLQAYEAYEEKDLDSAAEALDNVNRKHLSEDAQTLYDTISEEVNEEKLSDLYSTGYSAYNKYNYEDAAEAFQEIVDIDEEYKDGYAVYYLAQSYRHLEKTQKAIKYYERVVELYPNTSRASTAESYIEELSEEDTEDTEDTEGTTTD